MQTAPTPSPGNTPPAAEEHLAPPWQQLRTACHAAGEISRQVHDGLRQGISVASLIPLLRRGASLARDIQLSISELSSAPQRRAAPSERAELLAQMESLLSMENENHRLLRSRGVKLTGPRGPRVIPRSRPRPGKQ